MNYEHLTRVPRVPRRRARDAGAADRKGAPDATRAFRAARPDTIAGGFPAAFLPTPREELRQDIRGLVAHSRHAAANFDHARAYEMAARRNIIGHEGIRFAPDVRDLDGTSDKGANDILSRDWARWSRKAACSVCGRLSLWDIQRQAVTGLVREGGLFLRLHVGRGPFGLQIEPMPFDLLDIDLTQPAGANFIEAGIEFDPDGKVAAYHVWNVPADAPHNRRRRRLRIPARQMLHLVDLYEIGAALGIPRGATALRMMNMGEAFEESAMAAADLGARLAVFYEQEATDVASGIDAGAAEPVAPGSAVVLPPGTRATMPTPHYPDAAVGPFLQHFGRGSASGYGVAYETLTGDMSGANYSTLHAGLIGERDEWRMLQKVVVEGLMQPLFDAWLPLAITSGRLPFQMSRLARYADAATWQPRGWPAVDPLKQANADKQGLADGTTTLTEIAARKGRTVDEIIAERIAERAAYEAAGLPDPYAASAVGAGPDPGSDDDETETEGGTDDDATD